MMNFRVLAGQAPLRIVAKAAISLLVVGIAAVLSREGTALAIIIIFTGVTGPTIRLVMMKMDGIYERIMVSPASKPRFFLEYAGYWVISVLLPLFPAITIMMILKGPVIIIPIISGTLLATALGTLAGFVSRGLSEAHLFALIASAVLIVLSFIRVPFSPFIPYSILSSPSPDPASLILSMILPSVVIVIIALAVSRS
jgi:hypothetical protein